MDIWERLFKKRRAADAAFHPFVGAVEERVRTPKGPRKSAEGGAQIRAELWAIIEGVEAKTGRHAFGFAGEDQVIMTSEALEVAIGANHESKLLRSGFSCMFMTPQTKASLLDYWSSAVDGFEGKPNTRHLLREKAALLATFVLHHYDIPCLAADPAISPTALEDDTINQLKLEAAAAWYRIIDELAYRFIRSDRDLFCDYLQDSLANLLALQGSSVVSILDHSYERSEEYGRFRDWVLDPPHEDEALLWITARYALGALSLAPSEAAIRAHVELFLEALAKARVRELLTGRQESDS